MSESSAELPVLLEGQEGEGGCLGPLHEEVGAEVVQKIIAGELSDGTAEVVNPAGDLDTHMPTSCIAQPEYRPAKRSGRWLASMILSALLTTGTTAAEMTVAAGPAAASCVDTRCDAPGTVELSGASWLGGQGVDVYSNGGSVANDAGRHYTRGIYDGEGWQCPELVNRLYLSRGWITNTWWGNGDQLYGTAPANLAKQLNGNISSLKPGDVISLGDTTTGTSRDDGGHAAIVGAVSGNEVTLINQNTPNVVSSATLSNGRLTMNGGWSANFPYYYVIGAIDAPAALGDEAPAHSVAAPDLISVLHQNTNSGKTEVRVLSASASPPFSSWDGGWATPEGWHSGNDVAYVASNCGSPGYPDIYEILHGNSPSGMTEIRKISATASPPYSAYGGGWITPDGLHASTDVSYIAAGCNSNGKPNIYEIQHQYSASGQTEIKEFDGSANFTRWAGGWTTPEGWHSGNDAAYVVSNCATNGQPNIYEILHKNSPSGMTEVRELNGGAATPYSTFVGGWVTPEGWHSGNDVNYTAIGCNANGQSNIAEILHQNTVSGFTEVKELDGSASQPFGQWIGGWVTPDGWHSGDDVAYIMP